MEAKVSGCMEESDAVGRFGGSRLEIRRGMQQVGFCLGHNHVKFQQLEHRN